MACFNHGFTILKQSLIVAITQEANFRSRHLLEAIGMKHTKTLMRFGALQRLYEITHLEHQDFQFWVYHYNQAEESR